ncbi:MAG: bifunctional phosphoglucose/phosphomannose isomerase [Candidatus Omnitrophota bacterium]|jgi:glucose/mannose-6-phosphate isomerase
MNKLDNLKSIKKLDRSDMLKFISGLPEQCLDAYGAGMSSDITKPPVKINNIVFAGMGGSGIGAELVKSCLERELSVPMSICRSYALPGFVKDDTLLFCSSYSGNTEETLSCFEEGVRKKAFIVTLGTGGKLKELSSANKCVHIPVPPGYPPRTAVGYMSIILLGVLAALGFVEDKKKDVDELYSALSGIRDKEAGFDVPARENIAKQIAAKLYKKYPVLYGTAGSTEAVSARWRGQIAENSKALSSSGVLPEMDHNEIVGWRFPEKLLKDFKVIMLCDKGDDERVRERARITVNVIKKSKAEVITLERNGSSRLARLFSLMYIGDFTSFYLAILNGIDPTPVDSIDYLKKELGKI